MPIMALPNLKIESREDAYRVLAEVQRYASRPHLRLVDPKFTKQAAFIRSKAKLKAAKCTRRAGKSYGIGLALYKAAIDHPGSTSLYLALTRDSARNIMWNDVMKTIAKKHDLGADFNETHLRVTLPNGSEIKLAGADASKEEMEKYLGGKYPLIVIDEAGSFKQDLRKLIYENLEPAVADYDGTIIVIGTPTALTQSFFFEVTQPQVERRERGWEVHEWNTFDNPYMDAKWRKIIDRKIAANPRVMETPAYRRMYLGEWVIDIDGLCYKYSHDRNFLQSLPTGDRYMTVLGVDLGYEDASAFVICQYSFVDKNLYIIDAYKQTNMDITAVAERIKFLIQKYDPAKIVIDNAAKQSVEEMRRRFNLPLDPADKTGKSDFIDIMSSELVAGVIKVLPGAEALSKEWGSLIWDRDKLERTKKREEHPACENHLADAALYAWRYCYNYMSQDDSPEIKTDEQRVEEWFEQEAEKLHTDKNLPWWEKKHA